MNFLNEDKNLHPQNCSKTPAVRSARAPATLIFAAGMLGVLSPIASAATITIACPKEDLIVSGWNGPIVFTYDGDATGTLKAKSGTFELSMPAKMEEISRVVDGVRHKTTAIRAFDKASSRMPELAALEACIAKAIDPAEAQDSDAYLNARDGCLPNTPISAAPVPITAFINIGIVPGEKPEELAPIVEIQRTYTDKTKAPGGTTRIDTFPGSCTVSGL